MRRALDVAPLNLIRRGGREDVNRKGDLEERVPLPPVDVGRDVEPRAVVAERKPLCVRAMENLAGNLERYPERPLFNDPHRRGRLGVVDLVVVKNIDVPGVPFVRAVLEGQKLVAFRAGGENLAVGGFVEDSSNVPVCVEFNPDEGVLEVPFTHAQPGVGQHSLAFLQRRRAVGLQRARRDKRSALDGLRRHAQARNLFG